MNGPLAQLYFLGRKCDWSAEEQLDILRTVASHAADLVSAEALIEAFSQELQAVPEQVAELTTYIDRSLARSTADQLSQVTQPVLESEESELLVLAMHIPKQEYDAVEEYLRLCSQEGPQATERLSEIHVKGWCGHCTHGQLCVLLNCTLGQAGYFEVTLVLNDDQPPEELNPTSLPLTTTLMEPVELGTLKGKDVYVVLLPD